MTWPAASVRWRSGSRPPPSGATRSNRGCSRARSPPPGTSRPWTTRSTSSSARQAQFEEEEIALLEEEEPLDSAAGGAPGGRRLPWPPRPARLNAAIAEAEQEIAAAIVAEEERRGPRAPRGCPTSWPTRYEVLRARLGGVGAARLVGDRCDGCHLTLPSVEVERIRHLPPEEFATCPQCDRILVH